MRKLNDEIADTLKILKIESVMCTSMSTESEVVGFLYIDSLQRPYGFRFEDVALFLDVSQRVALAIKYGRILTEDAAEADNWAGARGQS